jgi:epoxyqueuosine reductase QueG
VERGVVPSPSELGLAPKLAAAGVNVAGVLGSEDYDAQVPAGWRCRDLLPEARSAVVLASGGRPFFRAFADSREAPVAHASDAQDPLDAFLVGLVEAAAAAERERGFATATAYYFERRAGAFADFVGLAHSAGLGARSRLALLLHPEYGPWLAVRALLLTSREIAATSGDPAFEPCVGCEAPCQFACPGSALPETGFDLDRCVSTSRLELACRSGCAARRACVVGPEHHYDSDAEAYHRSAALTYVSQGAE